MKNKLLKSLLIGCLLNISSTASAGIINFNNTESDFTISELETNGFILKSTAVGFGLLDANRGGPFSTVHDSLITWTNTPGETTGFTLETISDDLFSLESFQSRNGYAEKLDPLTGIVTVEAPVTGVTVEGILFDGSSISQEFNADTKGRFSAGWTKLVSVEFIAYGELNRAVWDSIRFETFAAPAAMVSEPSSFAIFALSLFAFTARRFTRKQ